MHQKNLETGDESTEVFTYYRKAREGELRTENYTPKGIQDISNTRHIIGGDERRKLTPYECAKCSPYANVCRIISSFPKGVVYGTAVIWAKDAALTAGHCVYDPELGGWATTIELYPGQNDSESDDIKSEPFGSVYGRQAWTSIEYMNTLSDNEDWGLIELSEMKGLECGYIGITSCEDLPDLTGKDVYVTGYPNPTRSPIKGFIQYCGIGPVKGTTSKKIFYDVDTEEGQSGSPVYYWDYRWNVIGIHTKGYTKTSTGLDKDWNSCVKITRDRYEFFVSKRTE